MESQPIEGAVIPDTLRRLAPPIAKLLDSRINQPGREGLRLFSSFEMLLHFITGIVSRPSLGGRLRFKNVVKYRHHVAAKLDYGLPFAGSVGCF